MSAIPHNPNIPISDDRTECSQSSRSSVPSNAPRRHRFRFLRHAGLWSKVSVLAMLATLSGGAALVAPSSSASAASTYVNYQYPTWCHYVTSGTVDSPSWQLQLTGVPTTTTETMYIEEPSTLAAVSGTSYLLWVGRIAYQNSAGGWTYLNANPLVAVGIPTVSSNGVWSSIVWNNQYPASAFTVGVTTGHHYVVYGTTAWVNSSNQAIWTAAGYVPTDGSC
jgi:hypothetical protein